MPKMHVQRSVEIHAPKEKIYDLLSDFSHWQSWSPWLIMDPDATVTLADDNKSYEWTGKRVGDGTMKILKEDAERIDYDLNFLKPWKSQADVRFDIKEKGDITEVTWYMDSGLPFFLFWMRKAMEAYVGMDYSRGLNMLKDVAEEGKAQSELVFRGERKFEGFNYIGIKRETSMKNVGSDMEKDFTELEAYGNENGLSMETAFSQYHKWEPVKGKVTYTCGYAVESIPDNLKSSFVSGNLPAANIYTVEHVGKYDHLGNAWSTLMSMARSKEIKQKKNYHPFEIYLNDPANADPKDLRTEVNFPLK